MTVGAVAAGTAGTAAGGSGGNGDAVSDAEAFGYCSMGVFAAAVFASDGGVCLTEAAHFFKFVIAVFADIFVDGHR